ncbi:TRAP transporter small permease [Wenxinia marina]|uniref:TRAP transporter small permease protein n=1 Tax=Wenxinia marina DSM 24838 TaxID=1123501 RepID=A0A0D0Q8Q8_9RHOB|nr:TRAP transporter small permease subunit [Wenxinia marina]KIQ67498.1 TRAP-type C4-dicarboxylate transport system, small permease component [Wenxinia marina DSM 24838]GGL69060.1 C4-dicarboxylate ABC transporter permease [Wenxinia marina]
MPTRPSRWSLAARHAVDAVPALLLAAMFVAFIVQVFMRYVLDRPVGWTVEVCVIAWLWVILWGQSVSAREEDEIRFDIVYGTVSPRVRRAFRLVFSVFLVAIYAISLPAAWDYVAFMKIEETSYLDIPYSWVFSVFILFTVASIVRYALIFWGALRGREEPAATPDPQAVTRKDFSE